MKNRRLPAILLFAFLGFSQAFAQTEYLSDPAEEARAGALFREIRCVVCAGQSIADSNALLAHDMRMQVRQQIHQGAKDSEIKSYLTQRYGDGILMTPPLGRRTALLWFAPLLLLVSGALAACYHLRRTSSRKPKP